MLCFIKTVKYSCHLHTGSDERVAACSIGVSASTSLSSFLPEDIVVEKSVRVFGKHTLHCV